MEDSLKLVPSDVPKPYSWRILPMDTAPQIYQGRDSDSVDQWALSKAQARSTILFTVEYEELADIAMKYQRTLAQPVCISLQRLTAD